MACLPLSIRAAVVAALCLLSGGCAVGSVFVGPPFNYVPDYAAVPPPVSAPMLMMGVPHPDWI